MHESHTDLQANQSLRTKYAAFRVLGIVPARRGSKRIPGKNTREFCGKPLIVWALEAALRAQFISSLRVSSDDEDVLQIAAMYDEELPLRRPSQLAMDESPSIDYVRHVLTDAASRGQHFDAIAIVQPTTPLTTPQDIDATVRLLIESGADSAVSVVRVAHMVHPLKLKTLEGDRLVPFLEDEDGRFAYDQLPEVFVRNGSVYASRMHVFERGHVVGEDCRAYVMPRDRSIDINDEHDWEFAELLLRKQGSSIHEAGMEAGEEK